MQNVKEPGRKELLTFAVLLPAFLALLAWIAVEKPTGILIALYICLYGALLRLLTYPGSWKRKLQAFAIPVALLALYSLARDVEVGVTVGVAVLLGVILGVLIILSPVGKSIYSGWLKIAEPIGHAISMTVLALTYFLVLTPIGWLMRTIRRDPMKLELDRVAATYWTKHEPVTDTERYFRQF